MSRLFYFIPILNQALSFLSPAGGGWGWLGRRDIIIDLEMELEILMGDLWIRNLLTD